MDRDVTLSPNLTGRIALVTGASRGIGAAIARALAQAGADVGINYRERGDDAERVAAQVVAHGRRAIVVQADVSHSEQVAGMISTVGETLGVPDILVKTLVSL